MGERKKRLPNFFIIQISPFSNPRRENGKKECNREHSNSSVYANAEKDPHLRALKKFCNLKFPIAATS